MLWIHRFMALSYQMLSNLKKLTNWKFCQRINIKLIIAALDDENIHCLCSLLRIIACVLDYLIIPMIYWRHLCNQLSLIRSYFSLIDLYLWQLDIGSGITWKIIVKIWVDLLSTRAFYLPMSIYRSCMSHLKSWPHSSDF